MKTQNLFLLLTLLSIAGCKKDEPEPTGSSGPVTTNPTPTVVSMEVIMNDTTFSWVLGSHCTEQYIQNANSDLGLTTITLSGDVTYDDFDVADDYRYFGLTMPTYSVTDSSWAANPTAAFHEFFENMAPTAPGGSLALWLNDGQWFSVGDVISGDWVTSYVPYNNEFFGPMVRSHGEVVLNMHHNVVDGEDYHATVKFTLEFIQPD